MSTYSLSGAGTHALTTGTTGLQVTITTPSVIGGVGRSNPVAKYDQGLIRFSDGTAYWPPVPVLGGPQFIPVPANATSIGYALLGGAVISVAEVIGGTVFFSGSIPSVEQLSDVSVSSVVDGQVLEWIASASQWQNRTPSTGGGSLTSTSATPGSDTTLASANTWYDLCSLSLAAGSWLLIAHALFQTTSGGAGDAEMRIWDGSTIYAETQGLVGTSSFADQLYATAIVALGSLTTLKISAASHNASITQILRDPTHNSGASHTGTGLLALKIV